MVTFVSKMASNKRPSDSTALEQPLKKSKTAPSNIATGTNIQPGKKNRKAICIIKQ